MTEPKRFVTVVKPQHYGDVLGHHLPWAFFSGVLLIVACFVPISWIPKIPCYFLRITDYPCPFCGMSRACFAMGHGHVPEAFYESPAGALFFVIVAVFFVWNACALLIGRRISFDRGSQILRSHTTWIITAVALILALNWAYRIVSGFK